ncbi:MAG: DUF2723 domain-containing protein [Anaerolineae bacterium]|nr:DUF2723 domain-containing protein [Anaerolineae bacterium]
MAERGTEIIGAACTAALLVVYGATMAPTLTWAHYGADGGDLVTAVARGSIPHPPGFPTYLLLGELFIRLPWGEPAWRLNLMSAVLAAGAAGLTAAAIRLLLRSRICNPQPATSNPQPQIPNLQSPFSILNSPLSTLLSPLCAGLSLGLAPLFWSQALIAEVYAPAAFFAALVGYLALRGGPAWVLGLAWGVGMGAHPTLLFMAPLVVWGAWKKPGFSKKTWFLAQTGLLALLGWGVMYGPVLLARSGVPSPWGDVSTLSGWWTLVSGWMYHGYLFSLPPAAWSQRLLAWAGLLARQFTPWGALLAGLGWVRLWRRWRSLACASALTFGAFSLYAVGYNTADSLVYLALALPLAALWLGMGLAQAANWLEKRLPRGAWLLLLLPLLQALLFWGQMDLSGDRAAVEWAERVLEEAPPQAMLLTAQDAHTFTLWYVHDVLDERPDVVVVDQDLWGQEPYRRMMAEALDLVDASAGLSPEEAARRAGRPIVRMTDQ